MSTDSENTEEKKTRTAEIELETHEIATKTTTPLHTTDWYIKWVSSIILIIGMVLASNNLYPWNILVQCIGICGWLVVALMWNDRSLIIVNAVGLAILMNGLIGYWLKLG